MSRICSISFNLFSTVILLEVDVVISVWLVGDSTLGLGVIVIVIQIVIFYLNTEIYKTYQKCIDNIIINNNDIVLQ